MMGSRQPAGFHAFRGLQGQTSLVRQVPDNFGYQVKVTLMYKVLHKIVQVRL